MPFLRETLASVAAQTFTNHEMLVWYDESTDGTLDELHRWIPFPIPGRIFSGSSFRLGANLAFLLTRAKTELCARMDGDDINLPTRLEKQVAYMVAHPEVVALGAQVALIDAKGRPLTGKWECPTSDAEVRWRTRWQCSLVHPAVLFRKTAVLRAGNYADVESEDSELWIRLCPFGEMCSLPDVLLHYRRHPASLTGPYNDFFALELRSARQAAVHLFPGVAREDALQLWELTHPSKVHKASVSLKQLLQFSRAATELARQCGKPRNYFKKTPTYQAQIYWLRRNLLRQSHLLKFVDALGYLRALVNPNKNDRN
jgi:glycosyltransferase involved in cell wall biosynthesis